MFPIALDVKKLPLLLIGQGELLARRQRQLEEAGATRLEVIQGTVLPPEKLTAVPVVMVAGLPRAQAEAIARQVRAAGKLVNVEDVPELCDFYFTASLRRGDLLIAVSTGGASPTLARKVRDRIAALFGSEWEERVRALAQLRQALKEDGADMKEVMHKTEAFLAEKEWLP